MDNELKKLLKKKIPDIPEASLCYWEYHPFSHYISDIDDYYSVTLSKNILFYKIVLNKKNNKIIRLVSKTPSFNLGKHMK